MKLVKCINSKWDEELEEGRIYEVEREYKVINTPYYTLVETTGGKTQERFENVSSVTDISTDDLLKELFRRIK